MELIPQIQIRLVYEAVTKGEIEGLNGYTKVQREVKFGDSRFDVYAENESEKCFIEVKNVTLKEGNYALFPDSVTTRGQKHLRTLIEVKSVGIRAVMFYVVQRSDVDIFAPAKEIDPDYAIALKMAVEAGVEIFAVRAKVSPKGIELKEKLQVEI